MLGPVIGDLLPSAVGVALSPLPIVAVILMLATAKGRVNGSAFAAGWVLGLGVVSVLVVFLVGGADDSGSGTNTLVDWLKIALGILLLQLARKNWDKRPAAGEEPQLPGWMNSLQEIQPPRAFVLGAALGGVNPKNLALTIAGAGAIAQAGLSAGGDVAAVAIFVLMGSVSILVPVVGYLVLGERAESALAAGRRWMVDNNTTMMMVVCLVLAAKLVGAGIGGLTD